MPDFYEEHGQELFTEEYIQTTDEIYRQAIEQELSKLILDKLSGMGINGAAVRIDITVHGEELEISQIFVSLPAGSSARETEVQNSLSQELQLPVTVVSNKEEAV